MSKGVLLLSAGLDSSVALALFKEAGQSIILALTMDYGQRAASREITHAKQICEFFSVPHRVIELPWFSSFETGLLSGKIPNSKMSDLTIDAKTKQSAKAVWVPNRNGVMIEIAASFAENLKAEFVVVGFNQEESKTFPDNSTRYQELITNALQYSTANQVKVNSPTVLLDKRQIVAEGKRLHFPFHLLWSCYRGGFQMCGRCESCMRLKRAFIASEVANSVFEDPT